MKSESIWPQLCDKDNCNEKLRTDFFWFPDNCLQVFIPEESRTSWSIDYVYGVDVTFEQFFFVAPESEYNADLFFRVFHQQQNIFVGVLVFHCIRVLIVYKIMNLSLDLKNLCWKFLHSILMQPWTKSLKIKNCIGVHFVKIKKN